MGCDELFKISDTCELLYLRLTQLSARALGQLLSAWLPR